MRHIYFLTLFITAGWYHAKATEKISIVPQPVSVKTQPGYFQLDKTVFLLVASGDTGLLNTARLFAQQLKATTGFNLAIQEGKSMRKSKSIQLSRNIVEDPSLGKEGYKLKVLPGTILLQANAPAGIFYGLQSLLQLVPITEDTAKGKASHVFLVPCADIVDFPRFGYRGMMLDVSRHFFSKEEVKQFIKEMALYKYNTFHWHLTDDQGWRIQIKSFPRLTEIGAWRVPRTGPWGSFTAAEPGEAATYGGYYTHEDIVEVVQFARERFITIIPEIDVPAHSLAFVAAYPTMSCTQEVYTVSPGTDFYQKEDNALCIGNDSVYYMLDKIFEEVASLFPNPNIHIGGDEAYKGFWSACKKCRNLMAHSGMKTTDELQSYFVRRMDTMIQAKGKRIIGWDEVLEGGALSQNVTIMSRYDPLGWKAAARRGHPVIVTPWGYTYWDLYQGDPTLEPLTYGMGRLKATYHFDPVPDSIDTRLILGGQGCLWTEFVPTFRHAQYMIWPRSLALSEVLWSPIKERNWVNFLQRMERQLERFDVYDINYSKSVYDPIVQTKNNAEGQLAVLLDCEIPDAQIYYTFDETNPDHHSALYNKGEWLYFPKGAAQIKVITYRNNKPMGKQLNLMKTVLEKRASASP